MSIILITSLPLTPAMRHFVPLETFTQWPIYYSVDYLGLHMRTHVGKQPP